MKAKNFKATIGKIGINPVVDPPDHVLRAVFRQADRNRGPIPVCGRLGAAEFIQTLVKFRGKWRLYINAAMLRDSGSRVGSEVEIEIEFDPRPREQPMPSKLNTEFRKNAKAAKAFDLLPPSRRREILGYINSLKSDDSIERNVARLISHLCRGDDDPALSRRKRE